MLTIGRKGKRHGFETETHEVEAPIGREGKGQGFETETQEILSTYTKRVIEAGIINRDPGGPEHL